MTHRDLRSLVDGAPGSAPDGTPDNVIPFTPRRAA
jgi:hypothetical protein